MITRRARFLHYWLSITFRFHTSQCRQLYTKNAKLLFHAIFGLVLLRALDVRADAAYYHGWAIVGRRR